MAVCRSQYAHARIESVDTSAAAALEGVVAVYTREDLHESGLAGTMPGGGGDHVVSVDRPMLVDSVARFQGDAIAVVVAEDRSLADDAASHVEIDYERCDAVATVADTRAADAPAVHDSVPDNVAFEWEAGEPEDTERAFEAAETVVDLDLDINRVAAVSLEPRAMVARYRGSTGELAVDLSCQGVIAEQDRFASVFDIPEHKVSVRAPDVGGGFGVKAQSYASHYLTAWAAMQLERPVKWAGTRTEEFVTTNHSRRHSLTASAAIGDDGRIAGLHVDSTANVGAYLTEGGAGVPTFAFGTRLLGQYDIAAAHVEVTGMFTNTTPLSAYRGAGRPEAAYVIERLVSACARRLDEDPVEFRRRNFIPPEAFPYETPFGLSYDSDDYEKPLDCVGLLLVAADVGHRESDRFAVRDKVGGAVSVAGSGAVFGAHPAKLAFLVVVGTMVGVIDEIDGDDPRPRAVEDRHGQLPEQEVGGELEPASIEGVEPVEGSIVAGSLVILGADLSNGGLIDAGEDNDKPDVARIEG